MNQTSDPIIDGAIGHRTPRVGSRMTRAVKTRVDAVYVQIRGDILAGRLHPGDKLLLADLAQRYGAKMGTVREALLKLAGEEDLVISEPQIGFRVRPISADDLQELTEARCVIEAEVFRLAIEHGDLEWESRVVASHHRLTRVPQMEPDDPDRISDAWASAHADFHEALLSGCTNSRLRSVALAWRESAEIYRRWSVTTPHKGRDIAAEHEAMCNAAVARDGERGAELLRAHIATTTTAVLAAETLSDVEN